MRRQHTAESTLLSFFAFAAQSIGRIPLSEATLIEDVNEPFQFVLDDGGERMLGCDDNGRERHLCTLRHKIRSAARARRTTVSQSMIGCVCRTAEGSMCSASNQPVESIAVPGSAPGGSAAGIFSSAKDYNGYDFKIIWDCKSGPVVTLHLVAPTMQEKAAWTSDISQVSAALGDRGCVASRERGTTQSNAAGHGEPAAFICVMFTSLLFRV